MVDRRRARSRTCQTERPVPQGLYPLVDQTGGFAIRNHRGELLQGQEAEVCATTNDLHSLIKYSYELQGLAEVIPEITDPRVRREVFAADHDFVTDRSPVRALPTGLTHPRGAAAERSHRSFERVEFAIR
jgi:hypothetical protein